MKIMIKKDAIIYESDYAHVATLKAVTNYNTLCLNYLRCKNIYSDYIYTRLGRLINSVGYIVWEDDTNVCMYVSDLDSIRNLKEFHIVELIK